MIWLLGGGFLLAVLLVAGLFLIDRNSIKRVNKVTGASSNKSPETESGLLFEDTEDIASQINEHFQKGNFALIDQVVDKLEFFPREKQNLIRQSLTQSGIQERYKAGLAEKDYKTRAASAERLGKIGGEGVAVMLFQAMADKNEEVCMAATSALKKLKDPSTAGFLIDALKFPNKWLPARVAEVLVSLGEVAASALRGALGDSDPVIRGYVIELLGEMGTPLHASMLYPALKDEHSNVRLQAARVLGKLGSQNSVDHLGELLQDPEPKVRIQAIRSIGKIDGARAVHYLSEVLNPGEEYIVQQTVFDSLKLMGPEGLKVIQVIAAQNGHPLAEKAQAYIKSGSDNSAKIDDSTKINISFR